MNYAIIRRRMVNKKHWVGECLGWFRMWTDSASAEPTPFVQENKHGALVIVTWDKVVFYRHLQRYVVRYGKDTP